MLPVFTTNADCAPLYLVVVTPHCELTVVSFEEKLMGRTTVGEQPTGKELPLNKSASCVMEVTIGPLAPLVEDVLPGGLVHLCGM